MGDVEWTEKRMARLRKLCARKDLSFGDIANILSREWGITVPRNGCIGKAHRMGISRRPGPGGSGRRPRRPSEPATQAPVENVLRIWPRWRVDVPVDSPGLGKGKYTLTQLDGNMCHWPFGDRAPYLFCGAPTAGRSYCAFHTGIACGMKLARERVMA